MRENIEPPERLYLGILARIEREKRRIAVIRLAFFGVVASASLAAIIPSFKYVAREFAQSGFYEYLFLLFSDSDAVLASWREFALSLAESLPITEITIFLVMVFVFLVSAKLAIKNIYINSNRKFKLT